MKQQNLVLDLLKMLGKSKTYVYVYLGTYFAFIVRGYNGVITHILKAYIEPSFFMVLRSE